VPVLVEDLHPDGVEYHGRELVTFVAEHCVAGKVISATASW